MTVKAQAAQIITNFHAPCEREHTQDEVDEFQACVHQWVSLEQAIGDALTRAVAQETERCARIARAFEPDQRAAHVTYASDALPRTGRAGGRMSCEQCEEQTVQRIAYYRWHTANIGMIGCDQHLREVFDALSIVQQGARGGQEGA